MKRKDYTILADVIVKMAKVVEVTQPEAAQKIALATLELTAYELIETLQADNQAFSRDKFSQYINEKTEKLYIV